MSKDFPEMEYKPIADGEPVQFPEGTTAHRILQLGYLGKVKLSHQQIRCAALALPHESPKLGVIATTNMTTEDFGAMLDRAIARSQVKLIEHRQDEVAKPAQPAPIPPRGTERVGPTPDRRFRRG
jgi:hypothetical protein